MWNNSIIEEETKGPLDVENLINAVQNVAAANSNNRILDAPKDCRPLMYGLTQVLCRLFLWWLDIITDTTPAAATSKLVHVADSAINSSSSTIVAVIFT